MYQNIANDQSSVNYDAGNEIIYNAEVLKSSNWAYNDAYILVRVTAVQDNENEVSFKNNAPFINCIPKINGTAIDDAEDLDLVMPMYDLLKCCSNYSDTTDSLCFYVKDETNNFTNDIDTNDFFLSNYLI